MDVVDSVTGMTAENHHPAAAPDFTQTHFTNDIQISTSNHESTQTKSNDNFLSSPNVVDNPVGTHTDKFSESSLIHTRKSSEQPLIHHDNSTIDHQPAQEPNASIDPTPSDTSSDMQTSDNETIGFDRSSTHLKNSQQIDPSIEIKEKSLCTLPVFIKAVSKRNSDYPITGFSIASQMLAAFQLADPNLRITTPPQSSTQTSAKTLSDPKGQPIR
jgi:hypothetical protein